MARKLAALIKPVPIPLVASLPNSALAAAAVVPVPSVVLVGKDDDEIVRQAHIDAARDGGSIHSHVARLKREQSVPTPAE